MTEFQSRPAKVEGCAGELGTEGRAGLLGITVTVCMEEYGLISHVPVPPNPSPPPESCLPSSVNLYSGAPGPGEGDYRNLAVPMDTNTVE